MNKYGTRIAIGATLFAILLILLQYFYIGILVKREAEEYATEHASLTAKEIANSVEVYFRDALSITNSFASNFLVYKSSQLPRETIYELMRGTLKLNSNFLAIWTMWEPNAYDNRDLYFKDDSMHDPKGTFSVAYYYQDGQIKHEVNDTLDFNEPFYAIPKQYMQPIILDPFYYQYHGNEKIFFETSLISPIIENNQFLGVIGIDIDMYALQDRYNHLRVYEDGFVSLLSNSGTIVSHPITGYIEHNISEYTTNEQFALLDSLKAGNHFITQSNSLFLGEKVFRYFYPINIDYMAAPWYIMIEIPEKRIFKKADNLKFISTIFLLSTIILLLYLIYNIFDRKRNEKILYKAIEREEAGKMLIKNAFDQLKEKDKILEAIFNQTFSFLGLLDTEGKIIRINSPALEFIQRTEDELIGTDFIKSPWWSELPEELQKLDMALENAKKGKHITFETYHNNLNGGLTHILFSIKPIYNQEGIIIFLLPEGIDITKIKEAEQELQKYKEHLEELVNERTMEIKVLNEELVSSNEELQVVNEHISQQKEELTQTLVQLKKAHEQLVISEKMASLGLFTAGIAHELNNPINFISAGSHNMFEYLDDLKHSSLKDHPELQNFFKTADLLKKSIFTGIERTTEIILSLRNYSGSNSDQFMSYSPEKCIKDALIILHNKIKNRIEIKELYGRVPDIECIPGKLNQLFVNIIANAIDSIENKGIITITTLYRINEVEMVVTDTGEGMDDEVIPRIFDPFFTTKPVGKGVGLGMYIVYGIVEKHNGSIKVKSKKGKGTAIYITLPVHQNG